MALRGILAGAGLPLFPPLPPPAGVDVFAPPFLQFVHQFAVNSNGTRAAGGGLVA